MRDIYTVYGSGGYAREVMPLLRDRVGIEAQRFNCEVLFVDDFADSEKSINGHRVVGFTQLLDEYTGCNIYCCIAIADRKTRERLTGKCVQNGLVMKTVQSVNSVCMDAVKIGEGSVISPFVTITSNVEIGKSFHANIYSYVAHDCVIGDFVTFAPSVRCNGNVQIKDGVYVGTGAIIHPGVQDNPIVIGENSKVAAGAVVTKSVPDNVTVIGNPAQILTRELLKKIRSEA